MPENNPELVPLPLETNCIGFFQLSDCVNAALRTQIGDRLRLQEQNSGVLHLLKAIQQHAGVPAAERWVMEESIGCMIDVLATATVQSEDIAPSGPGISVSQLVRSSHLALRKKETRHKPRTWEECLGDVIDQRDNNPCKQ
ncbi:hypothetical protein B0H11DRAFT_1904937 [Mycena galericulata]|nr:hypothetical protein B0H11DRAFT_1904937 [Mycena galericulata]